MSSATTNYACRGPHRRGKAEAFSRLELVVILGVLGLLAVLALPAVANTKARAERAACVNNLSRIGQAFDTWASSRLDLYPMYVSYSGSVDGGTRSHPSGLQNNIYFQFAWVSNELRTPKILVCPSDPTRRLASSWGFNSAGGFIHPNYQNNAVSYILGHPTLDSGRGILSGDRNITGSQYTVGCSTGIAPIRSIPVPPPLNGIWDADIHVNTGNLLFNDGSVEQTDHAGFRHSLTNQASETGSFHFMSP